MELKVQGEAVPARRIILRTKAATEQRARASAAVPAAAVRARLIAAAMPELRIVDKVVTVLAAQVIARPEGEPVTR